MINSFIPNQISQSQDIVPELTREQLHELDRTKAELNDIKAELKRTKAELDDTKSTLDAAREQVSRKYVWTDK